MNGLQMRAISFPQPSMRRDSGAMSVSSEKFGETGDRFSQTLEVALAADPILL